MLENLNTVLQYTVDRQSAVGAFNGYNYETFKGIIEAGEATKKPVIIAFGAKYLSNMSLKTVSALVDSLANEFSVPICLHLDHCTNTDIIFQAITSGFTSVMYDGSRFSLNENIVNTKKVCEVAHANGISVEAELGCISTGLFSHEGGVNDVLMYTEPKAAKQFVDATNVDALAVSIGTVHGMYNKAPNLRDDILKQIHDLVSIPLVLHGGSGLSQKELNACITNGIKKVNINTEMSMFVVKKTREFLKKYDVHYSVLALKQIEYVKEIVEKYIIYLNGGNI